MVFAVGLNMAVMEIWKLIRAQAVSTVHLGISDRKAMAERELQEILTLKAFLL